MRNINKFEKGFVPTVIVWIVVALLIVGGGFYYYANQTKTTNSQNDNEQYTAMGIVRSSGFHDFAIPSADPSNKQQYQLTDFPYQEGEVAGYYLTGNDNFSSWQGKCAGVIGTVENSKIDAFQRKVLSVKKIKELEPQNCKSFYDKESKRIEDANKNAVMDNPPKIETLKGVLVRGARPASDISYDYALIVDKTDTHKLLEDGSGMPRSGTFLVVNAYEVWCLLENNIGQEVILKGQQGGGYAESVVFVVDSLVK